MRELSHIFQQAIEASVGVGGEIVEIVFGTSKVAGQVIGKVGQTTVGTTIEITKKGEEILFDTSKATTQVVFHEEVVHHEPYLIPIEPSLGWDEALVFINGFLSEGETQPWRKRLLWETIRRAGWKGSLYYLWWDASNPASLVLSTLKLGVGLLAHWEAHKAKAKEVGLEYAYPLLSSLPERQITLMGFSLGARIAYYVMRGWPQTANRRLKDIILLSGAVRRQADKHWSLHVENITGKLVNIYNEDDAVLAFVFKVPSLNRSPCGIKPIKEFHPRIENLNATHLIGSGEHSYEAYLPHLEFLLDQKLDWKARRSRWV
ncbi:TMCO4 family protein [Synechococcus sp. R55.3]|jgi:pimeloyl-ACP methyl ester carboxylesterase|uniref:DUF726 domain-containing protein n=1 Tax=unclassified Synechococcus TaxID=2626047 RepID=UPI0039C3B4D8